MKIHKVTDGTGAVHLVKAHTKAGARRYVAAKLGQQLHAKVATQDELVDALKVGIAIEDATDSPQASIPEPSQKESQE